MKTKICNRCGKDFEMERGNYHSVNCVECRKLVSSGQTWEERYGEDTAKRMRVKRKGRRVSKNSEFKKNWQYEDGAEEILKKRIKNINKKPTKVEQQAIDLFEKNNRDI